MVRFYAVIFNKIGVLLNEIYVDIRSKSEAHQLIKDWIQKHPPGAGFLRQIFLHFPILLSRAGPLLFPKGRVGKDSFKRYKAPLIERVITILRNKEKAWLLKKIDKGFPRGEGEPAHPLFQLYKENDKVHNLVWRLIETQGIKRFYEWIIVGLLLLTVKPSLRRYSPVDAYNNSPGAAPLFQFPR
jgi:hypothetical protein